MKTKTIPTNAFPIIILALAMLMALTPAVSAQQVMWTANDRRPEEFAKARGVDRPSFPSDFKLFDLNMDAMRQELFRIVDSTGEPASTVISLPNADGDIEQFEVFEASNFEPDLQAQYPEIRAFSGRGITDPHATLKLSFSPQGVQTIVFRASSDIFMTPGGTEVMEPFSEDRATYAVFKSYRRSGELPWACSTEERESFAAMKPDASRLDLAASSAGQIKTMRLAQSCNAEYANFFGASTAGTAADTALVLAAFNATLTRANGVYEKDLAVHLNLIAATTNVIFYNPATDPYSTADDNWNSQLQSTLTALVGEANYDIGHMFGATGNNGNAGCIGCVCVDGEKGSGFTTRGVPMGDDFDIDFVTHEVGHQFGANHTYSFQNQTGLVPKEVGSGITIMGYAGITPYDVANHSIPSYHEGSIAQVQANMATRTCTQTTNMTANQPPIVSPAANYTIPITTPFALTGAATDPEGDPITYVWEQSDLATTFGSTSSASPTKLTGPNWLSFSPSTNPTRTFPRLSTILAGQFVTGVLPGGNPAVDIEALSSVSRTLNFRLTVRDNRPYVPGSTIGQTQFTNSTVTVTAGAGPFRVASFNSDTTVLAGAATTVTWDVANTNAAPVSTANVKISLSTDGGLTFPVVLANSTPNDGSESVTMPATLTGTARLKIEAVGNIFFDISDSNFTISATGPSPTPSPSPTAPPSPTPTPGDGDTDPDFVSRLFGGISDGTGGMHAGVFDIVIQPDGKILAAGEFLSFANRVQRGLARLNADGSPDYAFHPRVNGTVNAVILQPDGKIVIGGAFTEVNGLAFARVARLNADGTTDLSFQNPNVNNTVTELALQNDKIIVGGLFRNIADTPREYLGRLNANGSLDTTFNSPLFITESVGTIVVTPNGRIYLGGGMQLGPQGTGFARLNDNGSFDPTFTGDVGSGVNHAVRLANGDFLIGGVIAGGMKRVNDNGNEITSFAISGVILNQVYDFVVQGDGRIIVGASMFNGPPNSATLARLSPNGAIEAAYQPNIPNGNVVALAIQSNDKIIAGGNFTSVRGQTRNSLVRLNTDASLDLFPEDISLGIATSGAGVRAIITQPDGKILVAMRQLTSAGGLTRNYLVRINTDGRIDTTFNDPAISNLGSYGVVSLAVQPHDGKILIGGDFQLVGGNPRRMIARLHPNGSLDTSFSATVAGSSISHVTTITVQTDRKIMIGGVFETVDGQARRGMARLNENGTLDASFDRGFQTCTPETIDVLPDGKMLACGSAGFGQSGLARYNQNGTFDTSFTIADMTSTPTRSFRTPEGKIIIIGSFGTVAGIPRQSIARLNANGTLDTSFQELAFVSGQGSTITDAAVQSNGKVIIGGIFLNLNGQQYKNLARLNTDGTLDPTFKPLANIEWGDSGQVYDVQLQADGRVLVGGDFRSINRVGVDYIARLYNGFTPGCSYSASPPDRTFSAAGASSNFGVVAGTGCDWTASSSASWLTITSGSSGSGNGTINYTVDVNNTGSPRTATIDFGGPNGQASHTVTQQSANPSPTPTVAPSPTPTVAPSPTPTPVTTPTPVASPSPTGTPIIKVYTGPVVAIPDNAAAGVNIPMNVSGVGRIADMNFRIDGSAGSSDPGSATVGLNHSWIGDVTIKLTSPSGTTVTVFDRPGFPEFSSGCNGNNLFNLVLDDEGNLPPIENQCPPGDNAGPLSGNFSPQNPLSAFDGQDVDGNWTVNVSDSAGQDTGSMRVFSLIFTKAAVVPTPTPTPVVSPTPTPVASPTPTPTPVPTPSPATSPTPTPTPNPSPSPTPSSGIKVVSYLGNAVAIPDNAAAGVNISLPVGSVGQFTDLDFRIDGTGASADPASTTVGLNHSWIGDLVIKITSPAGTTVTIMDRPGVPATASGCNGNNLHNLTLNDDGGLPAIEGQCTAGDNSGPLTGSFSPNSALSAFDGQNADGNWTINISDNAGQDTGSIRAFSLVFTTPAATQTATISGRVTTPNGIALRNALVSIFDSQNVRRTALTSSFGLYSFTGVKVGEAHTISISSRRYRFTPRSLTPSADMANVDFVGLE